MDVAYCEDSSSYATGYAVFDNRNDLVAAGCKPIKPPGSVMAAELITIKNGLLLGNLNSQTPWRIYSDSINAIHVIQLGKRYKGVEENIILTIKQLMRDSSVEGVWYCKRTQNTKAHTMAKYATRSPQSHA